MYVCGFNPTDRAAPAIEYYYASRLAGEQAAKDDIHFHPMEPRFFRIALTRSLSRAARAGAYMMLALRELASERNTIGCAGCPTASCCVRCACRTIVCKSPCRADFAHTGSACAASPVNA